MAPAHRAGLNSGMGMNPGKWVGGVLAGFIAVLWLGGWTGGVLFFDYMIFGAASQQYQTRHWVATPGVIDSCGVQESKDSEGSSYRLDLKYHYTVDDHIYNETTDSKTTALFFGTKNRVEARAAELPAGSAVTVYYDPAIPSRGVLRQGIDFNAVAELSFMALFLTPFNLVMLASWWVALSWLFRSMRRDPPAGVRVFDAGMNHCIRLPHASITGTAAALAGILSFVMVFVVALGFVATGIAWLSFAGWAMVVLGTLYGCRRQARAIAAGRYDLVIDSLRNTIRVPPCGEKREVLEIAVNELEGVAIEKDETKDSDGDSVTKYFPTLQYSGTQRVRITPIASEDEATRFAAWLAGKLNSTVLTG
jgi:hypothetical protein